MENKLFHLLGLDCFSTRFFVLRFLFFVKPIAPVDDSLEHLFKGKQYLFISRQNTFLNGRSSVISVIVFVYHIYWYILFAAQLLFEFNHKLNLSNSVNSINGLLDDTVKSAILTTCAIFVAFCVATNLYSCTHIFKALMFPQRKHLQKAISSLETVKSEGFMEALRSEVLLMIDMVCILVIHVSVRLFN